MRIVINQIDWRKRAFKQLDPAAQAGGGLSSVNAVICTLILASAALAILETEPVVVVGHETLFSSIEWLLLGTFAVEYAARVWSAVENPRYGPGLRGRLRFMRSPAALIDLAAMLSILSGVGGEAGFLLRLARLIRILRLARLGRFSSAMRQIGAALASRRYELAVSIGAGAMLVVFSSALLYLAEGGAQPETFGSIPRAMWWSIATLTTVGYGDVYPITPLGKVFAALTAVSGIGMVAMPSGILAAAFTHAVQHKGET